MWMHHASRIRMEMTSVSFVFLQGMWTHRSAWYCSSSSTPSILSFGNCNGCTQSEWWCHSFQGSIGWTIKNKTGRKNFNPCIDHNDKVYPQGGGSGCMNRDLLYSICCKHIAWKIGVWVEFGSCWISNWWLSQSCASSFWWKVLTLLYSNRHASD